jgi:flagellum-specific ATP synthase
MCSVAPPEHLDSAQMIRELLSAYRDHEDLISIGAYRRGSNALIDLAIDTRDDINRFLRQRREESCTLAEAREELEQLVRRCAERRVTEKPTAIPAAI